MFKNLFKTTGESKLKYPIGYIFNKKLEFIRKMIKKNETIEYSLNEIFLPEYMKYTYFLGKPQSDFLGRLLKVDDEKEYVQFIDEDLAPKFSIIDLANNYATYIAKNPNILMIFGFENASTLEYYFVRPGDPTEHLIAPTYLKYTEDMPEFKNTKVIKRKLNYLLDMYGAKYEKIIFIGDKENIHFFDYDFVEFASIEEIQDLFDLTKPFIKQEDEFKLNLNRYGLFLFLPIIVIISILYYSSQSLTKHYAEYLQNITTSNSNLQIELKNKNDLLKKTKEKLILKEVYE